MYMTWIDWLLTCYHLTIFANGNGTGVIVIVTAYNIIIVNIVVVTAMVFVIIIIAWAGNMQQGCGSLNTSM